MGDKEVVEHATALAEHLMLNEGSSFTQFVRIGERHFKVRVEPFTPPVKTNSDEDDEC